MKCANCGHDIAFFDGRFQHYEPAIALYWSDKCKQYGCDCVNPEPLIV